MEKIKLIPADILSKTFSGQMFGYNKKEVESFLEMIANQLEEMMQEKNEGLNLEDTIDEDSNPQIPDKNLISNALIIAEQTKKDIIDNAKNEAENIKKSAELKAKKMISDAQQYLNVMEHEYINLKDKKKDFLLHFKSEIEILLERINNDPLFNVKTKTDNKGENNDQ